MPLDIIIGAQWGDEGKGRITDRLAERAAVTARYSGGDNAGHTVTVGSEIFKLHLLPSGLIHPGVVGVLGNGMVINPQRFIEEMDKLAARGVNVSSERVKISYAAHLITPAHIALDKASEAALGRGKIGTTGRGIGPAYTDKVARRGLRAESLADARVAADSVKAHIARANASLQGVYGQPPLDAEAVAAEFAAYAERIAPHIADTSMYLHQVLKAGMTVLAEGAQGGLLDIDHGTYPYVTSSSPVSGGAFTGLGVGPQFAGRIIGVTKAFQTRVGEGPFPTETFGAEAECLRGTGQNPWDEFGTTTGRPRRCGWLDLVLLRYSARINGLTELAITKLDVLSGLGRVRLCVGYRKEGKEFNELPLGPSHLEGFEAIYEDAPGWDEDVRGARALSDLPEAARHYLSRIEALAGLKISMVSVGPEREQMVIV
ncbi:MAG: adenylosuccinate synthase [Chloroflexi bacterium]|nr:adenylosuccinate synthase [Chloroflexota bacterium]